MTASAAVGAAASKSVVQVRIGRTHMAIGVEHVERAMPFPSAGLAQLPRRRSVLLGVVGLGEEAIPVLDIARWVPLGGDDQIGVPLDTDAADGSLLVLRGKGARIACRVDALLGVRACAAGNITRVQHADDPDEVFDSVVPADAKGPMMPILEVDRLMRLSDTWCSDVDRPETRSVGTRQAASIARIPDRWVLVEVGEATWAFPAEHVLRVVPARVPQLKFNADRGGGLCDWEGRKIPLLEFLRPGTPPSPLMAIVKFDSLTLAIGVRSCRQVAALDTSGAAPPLDKPWSAGTLDVSGHGGVHLVDVPRLFQLTPEAALGCAPALVDTKAPTSTSTSTSASHYIVFDTDKTYASAVGDILGIVPLTGHAVEALALTEKTVVTWRGRSVNVIQPPSIGDGQQSFIPAYAVLVEPAGAGGGVVGIAVRRLIEWLPPGRAKRSGLSMSTVGRLDMLTALIDGRPTSVVLVDLGILGTMLS